MHKLAFLCTLAALLAVQVPTSHAATPTQWRGTSVIEFSGTSTLHAWSGKVSPETFTAIVTMDDQGQPTALKAQVVVKAVKMDTKEPDRDKKMRESMKVADFPLITGTMDTSFDKVMMAGAKAPSRLPFTLKILGKEQQVDASISNWVLKGNTATFDLDFDLSLKQCGINVPSVMLVIRVADTIKLHASVKLVRP